MSSPAELNRFATLVDIMARLRAPDGCPWDRQQTHASLRSALLGECYEVLAALDGGDWDELCVELGDLLMQIVFQAQIAADAGEFEMGDVLRGISCKLVRRHPHIFGSLKLGDAREVALNWEELKKEERGDDGSLLDSVPREMPALAYSQEIQRRVAQVGFDWEDTSGIIDKVAEEASELEQADSPERKAQEFGDLLFILVNLARRLEIDSEAALREASRRFNRRFRAMEEACRQRGESVGELSFAEQNALWEEAKKNTE
ncbi:nucleoside triphosphate pyrophosphohydrolase [Chloroflexota bacterium]